ncbi:MAG: RagB/SusD family nutrient uptake outer membrane protein [Rikenellaceae bacterium]
MKKIYNIAIVLFSLSAINSCSDFLVQTDPNSISAETYWNDLGETNATLSSVYNILYHEEILTIEGSVLAADMGYPGYGRTGNPTNLTLAAYYYHTFVNTSDKVTDKWAALYTGIFRANQAIEALESLIENEVVTEDNEEWIYQMGQAKFFRGVFHFYLHSVFNKGDIIYYDSTPKTDADYYKSLTPSSEVIPLFRRDLTEAYNMLPVSWSSNSDLGRVTMGTAATILALSYMYEEEWDNAKIYLEVVINDCGYSLASPDIMFTAASGELTSESIFEICYSSGLKTDLDEYDDNSLTHALGNTYSTSSFTLPAWIVDAYQKEAIDPLNSINWVTDIEVVDGEPVEYERLRRMSWRGSSMIASPIDEDMPYYLSPSTTENITINKNSSIGFYRKYTNWDIVESEADSGEGKNRSGKNITINRLSEVYLLYAECMLEKGDVTTALEYINKIRKRWGLVLRGTTDQTGEDATQYTHDDVTYDVAMLTDTLRFAEKPLELSAEGHFIRNIDLRRWGVGQERFAALAKESYYLYGYTYISIANKETGTTTTKTSCYTQRLPGDDTSEVANSTFVIEDYRMAAQNYTDEDDGWWPIPLLEEQNNPNLYGE